MKETINQPLNTCHRETSSNNLRAPEIRNDTNNSNK